MTPDIAEAATLMPEAVTEAAYAPDDCGGAPTNVTLMGQSTLASDAPLLCWPSAQTRPAIERRRELMAGGRARCCYTRREWPR